jgi:lysophospholipase L1-like esterase
MLDSMWLFWDTGFFMGMTRRSWKLPAAVVLVLLLAAALGCSGSSDSPSSPSPTGGTVYAALGASDAVGVGASPLSAGYVFLISDRIAGVRGGVDLRNLGIPGARVDSFISVMLPQAAAAGPEIVTVWTGSNDLIAGMSPEAFGTQLNTLLSGLRARTGAQVFVGDLIDLTRAPRFRSTPDPDVTRSRIDAFNARIRSAAAVSGAVVVPLSAVPLDDSLFSGDGFHPSNEGHARLAGAFWAKIAPRI